MEIVGIAMTVYNVGCGLYMLYKNANVIKSYYDEKEKYRIIQKTESQSGQMGNLEDEMEEFQIINSPEN